MSNQWVCEPCYDIGMSRPQNEAVDILKVVLDNLLSGSVDLKSVHAAMCMYARYLAGVNSRLGFRMNYLATLGELVARTDVKPITEYQSP